MANFNDLIVGITKLADTKDVEGYFKDFFKYENFNSYEYDDDLNNTEIQAIKTMFNSNEPLEQRVDTAFKIDPFCIEAFFVYLMNAEDTFLSMRFDTYYKEARNFANFNSHEKKTYLKILDFFVDFLLNIGNVTKAIKIENLAISLYGDNKPYLQRLVKMYALLEDNKTLYKLYCENDFSIKDYILLIITELKHDEELLAQEITLDMFNKIKYAQYLDHVWDLDDNNAEQKAFYKAVDECYDDILSIPDFFSFMHRAREKYCK